MTFSDECDAGMHRGCGSSGGNGCDCDCHYEDLLAVMDVDEIAKARGM
jgi:hypothetical protein